MQSRRPKCRSGWVAQGTCPPQAREDAKLRSPTTSALARKAGGETAKGSATRTKGPRAPAPFRRGLGRAACPRRVLEPASGGPSVGQRRWGPGWGRVLPSAVRASHPCTCCPSPARQGVPGTPGMGRGRLPVAALGAEGRKAPQGSQREDELGAATFSCQKLGAQGLAPTRPPGGPHAREPPAAPGAERRPGQGRTEALTRTGLGTPRENFPRGWREAGERGPARARHLAPRIPRPGPRAPNLACVLSLLHHPRSWKVGVPRSGGGAPAPAWVCELRARLKSSRAEQAAAARLGVGRPALLASPPPLPPSLPPPCLYPSLPRPIRLSPRLSLALHLSPSPLPSPFFLPWSPALSPFPSSSPPLLLGGGASPLPPRQCWGCASPASPPASQGSGCQRFFRDRKSVG